MPLLALSFVHPAILAGLALAALPILIHILNRRRFKTMEWAAMDFLLKAAVRNRRRVRLENLLLLALRVLLVCLLVLAVARPFTSREDALAGLFGSEGATERIILLDDSHSMRAGVGNRSAFEAATRLIRRMADRLHDERSGDRMTVLLASEPRSGDERITRVPIAGSGHARLVERLADLRVSDGVLDVAAAVEAILDGYDEREARLVLYVVSDFRRRDWNDEAGALHPTVREALERFLARGEVRLIDVGSAPVQNAAVVELVPRDRAVIVGVPAAFVATVRNHGPEPLAAPQVPFRFGETVLTERVEGTLQPGEQAEVIKEFTFRAEGPVVASAEIASDVLPGDGVRRRVVSVRKVMRFLLVDGEPDPEPYRGETDFLAAALAPPGEVASGIEVDVVAETAFSGRELETYDGVFLCNLYRLPDDRLARLEDYVRAGGGLVFFLGDQVDPTIYNALFYGRGEEEGRKLLPLRLADIEGTGDAYVHLAGEGLEHPVVSFLRGMNRIVFHTVAVRRWIRGEAPRDGEGRVVLRLTDPDASPALAEKSFGEGRVLLFTTSADLEWSNFPQSMLFLAMVQEAARHVVRPDPAFATLLVSAPIEIAFDPTRMQRQAVLVPPAALGGSPVALTLSGDGERGLRFRYERTTVAGAYVLRLRTPEGAETALPFACNVDPTEGDLARADVGRLAADLPGARVERAGEEGLMAEGDESDRAEFWRTLLFVLLACAALETLLAWRFGHHRKRRLAPEGKQVFVR